MRPERTIQTRRKAPKSTFTMLYAATRSTKRRKQRAATTAAPEDLGEVPGVGIARALVVILLINMAAIAGIYFHNRGNEANDLRAKAPSIEKYSPPTLLDGYQHVWALSGDNHEIMARRFGVDKNEFMRLNENKLIKAGHKYNIPNRRIESVAPAEAVASAVSPPVEADLPAPIERPEIQTTNADLRPGSTPGELGPVESDLPARVEPTSEAVLIRPRNAEEESSGNPATPAVASSKTHVVKKGDSLWRIAINNGVTVDALMSLNGIKDATKLKLGAVLKIPAAQ